MALLDFNPLIAYGNILSYVFVSLAAIVALIASIRGKAKSRFVQAVSAGSILYGGALLCLLVFDEPELNIELLFPMFPIVLAGLSLWFQTRLENAP
jgi:hypothetical protein